MTSDSSTSPTPPPQSDEQTWRELARAQGVKPVRSLADMARPDLFESDQDLEDFLAHLAASRRGEPLVGDAMRWVPDGDAVGARNYAEPVPTMPVPDEELPPLPREGASPAEIRAALHPEYRAEFDRDYQAAMQEASKSLDLAEVLAVVESWRRRCCFTRDRERHRESMRHAAELLTGEVPPDDEPVSVTEARLFPPR